MGLEQREEELERRYQEFVIAQKGTVEITPYEMNPVVNAQKGKAARASPDQIKNSLNDMVDDLVDRLDLRNWRYIWERMQRRMLSLTRRMKGFLRINNKWETLGILLRGTY